MSSTPAVSPCDMDSHVDSAVQGRDWTVLHQLMESGQLTDQQTARVIVEVTKHGDGQQFSQHVLPFCSRAQLDSAMTELISAGLWVHVYNLSLYVGQEHSKWQVGLVSLDNHLIALVAEGKWKELGALVQNDTRVSAAQKQWAMLQACQRASQFEIIENVLPQCDDEDLDRVLKKLVSRGLWLAVGSLFRQRPALSETQKVWAIEKVAREATEWELNSFFHNYTKDQLVSVSKLLMAQQLWWVFSLLLKKDSHMFSQCILPAFENTDIDLFMSYLLSVGDWERVQKLLRIVQARKTQWKIGDVIIQGEQILWASQEQWRKLTTSIRDASVLAWVIEVATMRGRCNEIMEIIVDLCQISLTPFALNILVNQGYIGNAVRLLFRFVRETMTTDHQEEEFWKLLKNCCFGLKRGTEVFTKVREEQFEEIRKWFSNNRLKNIFFTSAVSIITQSLCGHLDTSTEPMSAEVHVEETLEKILREMRSDSSSLPQSIHRLCPEFKVASTNNSTFNPVFALLFVRAAMRHMNSPQRWRYDSEPFLSILTTVPVVPGIQREALKITLKERKWQIISLADLTYVGEQVRRMLFSSAVQWKQWDLVKQWADHTLSDDQRNWALEKACKEKQWDVCLRLAEHGLTEDEVTRVHFLVAMNADWEVVLDLYKHESDISEVNKLLSKGNHQMVKVGEKQEQEQNQRVLELANLEAELKTRMVSFETLESAVAQGDWQVVVFTVRQRPTADNVSRALKAAVASKAWSVVTELFRMGIQTFDQHPSFLEVVRNQQWGVCRVMIKQGLNTDQYMDAIPTLMEQNQWILVGKMMAYIDDDAVRWHTMQCALQRNEGSVVSQCILGMTQELSIQGREDLFHTAVITDTLQAVTPLVTEKDDTGVRHRGIALQQAVSQQQWDIVDLCLHHHADINMPDEKGDSLIQRAAQREDWDTVMALAERGRDPSRLDSTGMSVLHQAIRGEEWTCVESLIILCSTLYLSATHSGEQRTALEMLIDAGREDIIQDALSRKTYQWTGVNRWGETALHVMCLCGMHNDICPFLGEGVNPLSVTHGCHSVLSYAVMSRAQPTQMVSECISLGFSTHQPHITQTMQTQDESFLSPVQLSVMRGLPVITRMLYESGSCSFRELFLALPKLLTLTNECSIRKCTLYKEFLRQIVKINIQTKKHLTAEAPKRLIKRAARYLIEVSTTPRSLKSMCRLVISHSLKISPARDRDVSQLPIPQPLKNYVSFSDLLHADSSSDIAGENDGSDSDGEENSSGSWSDSYSSDDYNQWYSDDENDWSHYYSSDDYYQRYSDENKIDYWYWSDD
ncbi:uncharacterized protein LOC143289963 isoform X1 [Babylonia areolata]|uniref:uncharacterized protein LOC143289963 isoform X1 n=1 Tax=Babylonia areolata TaxID=304850 RepID=UPI003FD0AF9D